MSEKKAHFIPHPLCIEDPKIRQLQWDKQGVQSLREYISESPNPRWAASHLIRAIATGLGHIGLAELANELASRGPTPCIVQDANPELPIESHDATKA